MQRLILTCTSCGKEYGTDAPNFRCGDCGEPLELPLVQSGSIRRDGGLVQTPIGRYADFFPFAEQPHLSLGEGFTPLMEAPRLAEQLGIQRLHLKNETMNPTWSFKDRGTVAGLHHAVQLGYEQIGTVSSGNMATSVAAYGARAGLRTFVLVQSTIAAEKLAPVAIYGADLITVEGDYGELYDASLRIGTELGIYFINSDHPYRVEGSKTISFEIAEQLDFQMPDYLIVPTSAGGNLRGIDKGLREFHAAGLIARIPKLICAQSVGCAPIATAWGAGKERISHFGPTDTIAHAIENPNPPSGNQALRLLRRNGGHAVAVNNQEIIAAQAELAQAGVFAQPASAVPIAAIRRLRSEGYLTSHDHVAAVITGSGLKYTAAFQHHQCSYSTCKLEQLRDLIKSRI